MSMENPPFESMYFLLDMGIFQPVMLVFRDVIFHKKESQDPARPNQCRSPLLDRWVFVFFACFFAPQKNVAKNGRLETMSPYKPLWRPWRCSLVAPPARVKQQHQGTHIVSLGGGNSNVFYFHPYPWGKWSNLTNVFQMGWNHQLDQYSVLLFIYRFKWRPQLPSLGNVCYLVGRCRKYYWPGRSV